MRQNSPEILVFGVIVNDATKQEVGRFLALPAPQVRLHTLLRNTPLWKGCGFSVLQRTNYHFGNYESGSGVQEAQCTALNILTILNMPRILR